MPQGLMREVMETYKPHILSRRRRLIEDCVRDLRLNNDHIHIIEQEMRLSLQVKFDTFLPPSPILVFPPGGGVLAIFKRCANLHLGITTFLAFLRLSVNFLILKISFEFFQQGLSKEEHSTSSVKCFPTYVRSLPNGREQGKFLSLDLGGTNFRVIVMELTPDKEFLMDNKIYAIPQDVMTGNIIGQALMQ